MNTEPKPIDIEKEEAKIDWKNARISQKIGVTLFFIIPLLFFMFVRKVRFYWHLFLHKHWIWFKKHQETLFFLNLLLVIFSIALLFILQIMLHRVRGW